MKHNIHALAVDLGASGGRAMLGNWNGETLALEEVHRFSNDPVALGGVLYWDVLRLFFEIKQGLAKAKNHANFTTLGVDTWGVDFGLLGPDGHLMENPIHYRDTRTDGMMPHSDALLSREEFYRITGNQQMQLNTAYQLLSLQKNRPELLNSAHRLLLMPDLIGYFLTGCQTSELSIASTTQLLDCAAQQWSSNVLQALALPSRLLCPVTKPAAPLGGLLPALRQELGLGAAEVISVCGHDTQSAQVALPATDDNFAFISSGTWSLFGTELATPLLTEDARRHDFTNEAGFGGKISFLKNIVGLWLLQESRRQWQREGTQYSYHELSELCLAAPAFRSLIDPNAPQLAQPGNIPQKIQEYCRSTSQPIPETTGQIVRCIYESLALTYRSTLHGLRTLTGKTLPVIHMVGGGSKDSTLCQMTADACACPVTGGPAEATALGNILVQLIAKGEIAGLDEARSIVLASEQVVHYTPAGAAEWAAAAEKHAHILALANHGGN